MKMPLYVITSQDIMIIIALVLGVVTLILVLLLLLRKKEAVGLDENKINQALKDSISKEMLDLNDRLSRRLEENTRNQNQTIADLRVSLNKELGEFKNRLNEDLNKEFDKLADSVDKRMTGINEKVEERLTKGFESTNETFTNIQKSMAVVERAQNEIEVLSKEMLSLQDLLTNNQQRGAFGEYQLEQILYATFGDNPSLYDLQHEIKNPKEKEKVRADSIIFMPSGNICIDSKFPFSSYKRFFEEHLSDEEEIELIKKLKGEVKKHIDDVARKYIVPGETTDFAIMFLPSDGLLAFIHAHLPESIEYANTKGVIITAPTTLIPLIASYRIVKIDHVRAEQAKVITKELNNLKADFLRFGKRWEGLSNTIDKLSRESDDVTTTVNKLTVKFDKLSNSEVALLEGEDEDA